MAGGIDRGSATKNQRGGQTPRGDWRRGSTHRGVRDCRRISCAEPEGIVDHVHIMQRVHCRSEQKGKILLVYWCSRAKVYPQLLEQVAQTNPKESRIRYQEEDRAKNWCQLLHSRRERREVHGVGLCDGRRDRFGGRLCGWINTCLGGQEIRPFPDPPGQLFRRQRHMIVLEPAGVEDYYACGTHKGAPEGITCSKYDTGLAGGGHEMGNGGKLGCEPELEDAETNGESIKAGRR